MISPLGAMAGRPSGSCRWTSSHRRALLQPLERCEQCHVCYPLVDASIIPCGS